jgi:FAD dependent oxidoreductase
VPRNIGRLLIAGRHISCDPSSRSFLREIPQCWLTREAAGVGAALAGAKRCAPRAVSIAGLQAVLQKAGGDIARRNRAIAPPAGETAEAKS